MTTGLLDPDLAQLMAMSGNVDPDAARRNALMTMGLAMMGAPRGQEFQRIGQAGLLGMRAYQDEVAREHAQQAQRMQQAAATLQLSNTLRQMREEQSARNVAMQAFGGGSPVPTPTAPGGSSPAPVPAPAGAPAQTFPLAPQGGAPSPTPMPAGGAQAMPSPVIPAAPGKPAGGLGMSRRQLAQTYASVAQREFAAGNVEWGQKYQAMAQQIMPKVLKVDKVTDPTTGRQAMAYYFDDGEPPEILSNVAPPAMPLHFASNGQYAGIGLDPLTGKQVAPGVKVQISPDAALSAQTTMRGQDIGAQTAMRGQNLTHSLGEENISAENARAAASRDVQTAGQKIQAGELGLNTAKFQAEQGAKAQAEGQQLAVQQQFVDNVLSKIDQVLPEVKRNPFVSGALGALASKIPGSEPYDQRAMISSIKSALSQAQLQALRTASASGASGMGQLSNKENDLLAEAVANLDPNQSATALAQQLQSVQMHLRNVQSIINKIHAHGIPGNSTPVPNYMPQKSMSFSSLLGK